MYFNAFCVQRQRVFQYDYSGFVCAQSFFGFECNLAELNEMVFEVNRTAGRQIEIEERRRQNEKLAAVRRGHCAINTNIIFSIFS